MHHRLFARSLVTLPVLALVGCTGSVSSKLSDTITATIDPTEPTTVDDLVASASPSAAEGVQYRYEWHVDGLSTAYTDTTLAATETVKGQTWEVTITPVVVEAGGTVNQGISVTDQVLVLNTPPTAELTLTEAPLATEDITVEV
ncbi:MAG: hypothetical protein QGG40_16880, partial [Myxococcota bacterium]|nr:hypothetical protein [Myxococcota bacterium]